MTTRTQSSMPEEPRPRPGVQFFGRWTAAVTLAWFLTGMILAATGEWAELLWEPRLEAGALTAVYLALGLVMGGAQGLALWSLGRVAGRWFLATVAGSALGGALSVAVTAATNGAADWFGDVLFIGVAVALLQGLALVPDLGQRARHWPVLKLGIVVATTLLGSIAAIGILYLMTALPRELVLVISGATLGDLVAYGLFLTGYGVVFGSLSGAVLLKLYRQENDERWDAPLPGSMPPPA